MLVRLISIIFLIFFLLSLGISIFVDEIYLILFILGLFCIGIYDLIQKENNILRLYPIVGHFRFLLQYIRPQIQQYFIESNINGMPFSREQREMVYQRANNTLDRLPFGTQRDVYADGFDSINHSLLPKKVDISEARIQVGGKLCSKPYNSSRLNISAMSFGAISSNAVMALNKGAKLGDFAHNTGEGGISNYHLLGNGDLIWQLGTGYFGARTKNGGFSQELFKEKSNLSQVKMIELKLSQGAKPSEGGILPAAKINKEIAEIRGVDLGQDIISPPAHSEFYNPIGLLEFIQKLRELSGGKPVGFKLCLGSKTDFLSICKAMLETKILPDFITVDGAEGGTGAAPVEFSNNVGMPLNEGLIFIHNALVGCNLRDDIKLCASGKIISGFDMISKIALGADICNSARGMMFALGCVQSRRCHTNNCPTGVATTNPARNHAVDVKDKAQKVCNFHNATIKSFLNLLGATGLKRVNDLEPKFVYRRVHDSKILNYNQIYTFLEPGQLLENRDYIHIKNLSRVLSEYLEPWSFARADSFKDIKK